MPRFALDTLTLPWRALRATRAPLAVPGGGDVSGLPSMFDSGGASGQTISLSETEAGAHALNAHLESSPEVASMLLFDPAGVWAPGLLQALSDATGSPIDRLRVHAPGGLQVRALVDETLLPAGNGPQRLVRCLHGHARAADRRGVFGALLSHSRVCAVLVGPMPTGEAEALIEDMHRLAIHPSAASVRWLFFIGADHRGLEHRIEGHHWPHTPVILHARPLGRSLTVVWNKIYEAWLRLAP